VGSGASSAEREAAMGTVDKYLKGRSAHTYKVTEQAEPVAFKHKFCDFFEPPAPFEFDRDSRASGSGVAEAPRQRNSGEMAASMLSAAGRPKKKQVDDDGQGTLVVYRINDFEMERCSEGEQGQLYEGDSYIIHYTYLQRNKEMHLIYFWHGRESSQDEKGASALLTKELDDKLGGSATQVRPPPSPLLPPAPCPPALPFLPPPCPFLPPPSLPLSLLQVRAFRSLRF
jgi:hypothetical protein